MRLFVSGIFTLFLALGLGVLSGSDAQTTVNYEARDVVDPVQVLRLADDPPLGSIPFQVGPDPDPRFYIVPAAPVPPAKVEIGEKYKGFIQLDGQTAAFVCGDSTRGFELYQVNFLLQFDQACQITVRVDLEEADMSNPSCPFPGPEICRSAPTVVDIPAPGLWSIGVPIGDCGCVPLTGAYFFSMEMVSKTCNTGPYIVTNAITQNCITYIDPDGSGWVDLLTYFPSLPGNMSFTGDATCCENPVPVETTNWGELKGRYEEEE